MTRIYIGGPSRVSMEQHDPQLAANLVSMYEDVERACDDVGAEWTSTRTHGEALLHLDPTDFSQKILAEIDGSDAAVILVPAPQSADVAELAYSATAELGAASALGKPQLIVGVGEWRGSRFIVGLPNSTVAVDAESARSVAADFLARIL